jgi:hypothetical protein
VTGLTGVVAAARTGQWVSFADGVAALGDPAPMTDPTAGAPPAAAPAPADPAAAGPAAAGTGITAENALRDRPTPGVGASPTRLAAAPPAPVGGGTHAFLAVQDNGVTPVAYDPCRPVHYVLRPDSAPPGGEEIVHAAVARLAAATGLSFVHDGATDETVTEDRALYQPERYGDRWAPVLVAWQTEGENAALAGDVVGQGGSVAVSLGDGPRVFVTGTVVLDAGQFPGILERRDGLETATAIVLHELGHLVGLGHVEDAGQLMYPETRAGVTDLSAGDRTGLARLGRGACVPQL